MPSKKHLVFVNNDLDGAASLLIFKWLINKSDLLYKTVSRKSFPTIYDKWTKQNNIDEVSNIYVLDLDVTDYVEMLPAEKLVVIDNDPYHDPKKYNEGTRSFICSDKTSTAKTVYDLFNKKFDNKLTDAQKILMLLVDDNTSYSFSLKGAYELGLVFDNYQGDRVKKFTNDFHNGFQGFSQPQRAVIGFYKDKVNNVKRELDVFESNLPIGGKSYRFVSTFTNNFINEISDWLLKDFQGDISIVINPDINRVSFRRSKSCTVDLNKLAKKLSDGGGKEYSAGGYITDKLLELSKAFKPIR